MRKNTMAVDDRGTERLTDADAEAYGGSSGQLTPRVLELCPAGRALADRRPQCEACRTPTSDGDGDGTYGGLALAEYGIDEGEGGRNE